MEGLGWGVPWLFVRGLGATRVSRVCYSACVVESKGQCIYTCYGASGGCLVSHLRVNSPCRTLPLLALSSWTAHTQAAQAVVVQH
jgi:hypothetical protein